MQTAEETIDIGRAAFDPADEAERLPSTTPLRGRDGDLALLRRCLALAADGEGSIVLIEGAPGLGKSRMLDEACGYAADLGLRCLRGTGDHAGRPVPPASLLDVLLTGDDPLADAEALRGAATRPDERFWVLRELQERLERAALTAPLMIAVDDVQRSDPMTLLALRTLAPRLAGHPIVWVLAVCPDHRSAPLRATWTRLRDAGAHAVRLRPLDDDAVLAVAGDVLGAAPDAAALEVVHAVHGRPSLLVELLRGLLDAGAVRIEDGRAHLVDQHVPDRLRDLVGRRLDALPEPAAQLVRLASVLGRRCTLEQLAALAGASPQALLPGLREALEADLLVEHDGALGFRHDLIREAVDATLAAPQRRALQRRAVELLLRSGAPAVSVAEVLADTAEPGDRAAVDLLRQAASTLAPTAPGDAARLSVRALELAGEHAPERAALVTETIGLLWQAGRPAAARALAEDALAGLLEPEAEAQVRLRLARLIGEYSFVDAVRQSRIGSELRGVSPALHAELLAVLALNLANAGDIAMCEQTTLRALADVRAAGHEPAEATLLTVLSVVRYHQGDLSLALGLADDAVALAARSTDAGRLLGQEACWRSLLWASVDRLDDALAEADAGLRDAQRHGRPARMRVWMLVRARILLDAGRLADARSEAEAALAMVDELGAGNWADVTGVYALGRVALHIGDREHVARLGPVTGRMMGDESVQVRRAGAWLAALSAGAAGAADVAMAYMNDHGLYDALEHPEVSATVPVSPPDLVTFVRLAVRAGDRRRAGQAARAAERRAAAAPGVALPAAAAAHARGLLDGDLDLLRLAVRRYAASPRLMARASALEDLGRALAETGDGDGDEAPMVLDAALQAYATAGADRDAARVRRRLRKLGVRRRRAAATGPGTGWRGLTPSEQEVARLVAEGATNRAVAERLFLSPHTVSSHLRHAFEKLGIRSRVDLARMSAERDEADAAGVQNA